jgi:hypothetical protein
MLDAPAYPDAPADLDDMTAEFVLGDGAEPCDAEADDVIAN